MTAVIEAQIASFYCHLSYGLDEHMSIVFWQMLKFVTEISLHVSLVTCRWLSRVKCNHETHVNRVDGHVARAGDGSCSHRAGPAAPGWGTPTESHQHAPGQEHGGIQGGKLGPSSLHRRSTIFFGISEPQSTD